MKEHEGKEGKEGHEHHGHHVKKAIGEHQSSMVPFPTMHSSTPTSGGKFGGTKGPSGISHNDKDTGFANSKEPTG